MWASHEGLTSTIVARHCASFFLGDLPEVGAGQDARHVHEDVILRRTPRLHQPIAHASSDVCGILAPLRDRDFAGG
jgi:hypothetical protein